ncbi:MAG: flagellar protein FlaG [Nitrospinota bacterium]
MEFDISSLTGRLKSPGQPGLTSRPERETNYGEVKSDLSETRESPVSPSSETQVDINSLDNNKIDYQVNQETNEVVIRIVDSESGEVIRQIPGEEFLRLTSRIAEFNQKFLDQSV